MIGDAANCVAKILGRQMVLSVGAKHSEVDSMVAHPKRDLLSRLTLDNLRFHPFGRVVLLCDDPLHSVPRLTAANLPFDRIRQ